MHSTKMWGGLRNAQKPHPRYWVNSKAGHITNTPFLETIPLLPSHHVFHGLALLYRINDGLRELSEEEKCVVPYSAFHKFWLTQMMKSPTMTDESGQAGTIIYLTAVSINVIALLQLPSAPASLDYRQGGYEFGSSIWKAPHWVPRCRMFNVHTFAIILTTPHNLIAKVVGWTEAERLCLVCGNLVCWSERQHLKWEHPDTHCIPFAAMLWWLSKDLERYWPSLWAINGDLITSRVRFSKSLKGAAPLISICTHRGACLKTFQGWKMG